jgi:hypothetical protein
LEVEMSRRIGFAVMTMAGMVVGTGCGSGSPTGPDAVATPPPVTTPAATLTGVRVEGSASVAEGATLQLRATAAYSDGSSRDVSTQASWTSSRPSVASVSATGLVTAATTGTTDLSATFQGQTGRHTLAVGAAEWDVRIDLASFTASETCDDFTQGLDDMEVAYRIAVVLANGQQTVLADTGHPGNPSGTSLNGAVRLRQGQVVSLNQSRTFRLPGAAGQSARIEFRATEWDEQVVLVPPSVRWVRDGRMDDLSGSRTHGYSNGSWSSLGSNQVTLGVSGCRARIDYSVIATRR